MFEQSIIDPTYSGGIIPTSGNNNSLLGSFLNSVTDLGESAIQGYFLSKSDNDIYQKSLVEDGAAIAAGQPAPVGITSGFDWRYVLMALGAVVAVVMIKKL